MVDALIAFAKAHPFITVAAVMSGPVALGLVIEIIKIGAGSGAVPSSSSSSSGSGWWPHSHDDGPSCCCDDDD